MVPRVALRDGPLRACLLAGSGGFRQSWASFDLQPHPSGLCPHLPILSPECLCLPVTFSCLCVPMQMPLFQRHRLHWIWDPSSSGMTSPLPVTKTYFQARSRSQALGVRTSTCWGGGFDSAHSTELVPRSQALPVHFASHAPCPRQKRKTCPPHQGRLGCASNRI